MSLKFSDARRFGRTATGLLLVVGPATLLIGSIISPDTDHKNKLRELAAVSAHKGTYLAGGLIFLLGTILMTFAAIGVIRMFRGRRGVHARPGGRSDAGTARHRRRGLVCPRRDGV